MSSTPSPEQQARSRVPRWLKRGLIVFLVLANLGVLGVYLRLRSLENIVLDTAETLPEAVPSLTPTTPDRDDPITFLMIGSDSREGLDDLTNFGPAGGQRADVIMLVKIHPEDDRVQMLSIPRDLWVDIPGHGTNKVNAAYAFGGAPLIIDTVVRATGIPVNHYMEVDFVGFKAIVDEIGGVTIDFPYPARDQKSGLSVQAGSRTLDGTQALAYARSRTYQEYRNGSWTSVDANDFGRTRRQQQLVFAILSALKRPSTITEAGSIVRSFAEHLTIDQALAEGSIIQLGFRMRGVQPSSIEAATLPGTITTRGGASVVVRDDPAAAELLEAFRAGNPLVVTDDGPATIAVLNGNGVAGNAGVWADHLSAAGFEVAEVGDAQAKDYQQTVVIVRPGEVASGERIVDALGFGLVEVGTIQPEIDALVVMGLDGAAGPADPG